MAERSDLARFERQGLAITGAGVRFDVDWGSAGASRSDRVAVDRLTEAIDASAGLRTIQSATVTGLEVTGAGDRGAGGDGTIAVDLGRPDRDERRVLLVEEQGRYTWVIPDEGERFAQLPVEAVPGTRGSLPGAIRSVVRFVALRTAGWGVRHITRTLVGGWDEHRHPHRLRSWTPEDHRDTDAPLPDLESLKTRPSLLVIHGFTGSIHGSFGDLGADFVDAVHRAYGGHTFAFDHPTLAVSPRTNAEWLRSHLPAGMCIDIVAHSRGGLVAREIANLAHRDGDIVVRSITFVATPNAGTPLADPQRPAGLLDAVTNLLGAVPGSEVLELALELVKDVAIGSALQGLEGLVAMSPDDEHLRQLNANPAPPGVEMRAISADFEPRTDAGIVRTARDRLIDRYFGSVRNDLIVPTLSTIVSDADFRVPAGQRLVLDSSRGVDHSSFWTNPRATGQLLEWLRPDCKEVPPAPVPETETEPQAETALRPDPRRIGDVVSVLKELPGKAAVALENVLGGPVNADATPPTGARPAVVVIPGIMGTHLRTTEGGQMIWVDPVRLARGHFRDLSLAEPVTEVEAAGVNRTYLPLITHLATNWDVYLAPYDWRQDILESSRQVGELIERDILAGDERRAIHLVAHSMGGLVARGLAVVKPDVWKRLADDKRGDSGRLVMLGTPNAGSYSIPLTLTGSEMTLKALAAVDWRTPAERLVEVVATFPGIYQMLPAPDAGADDDQHAALFLAASWGARSPVRQDLLDAARRFHDAMAEVHDPDRLVLVAGYNHATPYRIEFDQPGAFTMGTVPTGDGRVASQLGRLPDVTTYYSTATHGGLPSGADVLGAVDELLITGTTDKLRADEPVYRGANALEGPHMSPIEDIDRAPVFRGRGAGDSVPRGWREVPPFIDDALRITIGGGQPAPNRPVVNVSVLNAGLEQARFPVAVGHHAGLPQEGAEAALDAKLDGALKTRQRLGQYPEQAGSASLIAAPTGHRPRGALVLGLGEFGSLTPGRLSAAMTQAVTALIVERRERGTEPGPGQALGVSSVLIGTPGRHGLTMEECVTSLVTGVAEAVLRADDPAHAGAPDQVELELVERFEQTAEDAALVVARLDDLLPTSVRDRVEVVPVLPVTQGDGRQPGALPAQESGTPWVRVTASLCEAPAVDVPVRKMNFSTLVGGAQANLIEHDLDLAKLQAYIDEAVRYGEHDRSVSRTLYEMLFPHRTKLDLDRTENLHLLVDDAMAEIPWELVAGRADGGESPQLALRAGMLRQLHSRNHTRERAERPDGREVLVVGDPRTSLPPLPGARDEAQRVVGLFRDSGWHVDDYIYGPDDDGQAGHWMRILDALNAQPYRVVHIAAHGIFDGPKSLRTGVVIGPETHHRITALDFRQMTVTPDLVFLNCCHLGRLGEFLKNVDAETRRSYEQPHRVAASVAEQLLRNGVKAVVVAGWAVDDFAAAEFAHTLYSLLLQGHPFGEAVRRARSSAHDADGGRTNTWGAYQCYGDPDVELVTDGAPRASSQRIVSSSQLVRELQLAAARAGDAVSAEHCAAIRDEVSVLRTAGGALLDDGRVLEALGEVLGELGDYQDAVNAYREALVDERSAVRLRTVEQLANFESRLAAAEARRPGADLAHAEQLFGSALERLDRVTLLAGETAQRRALSGSVHKKRAAVTNGVGRLDALRQAEAEYARAWEISSRGNERLNPHHTNLRLQLSVLAHQCELGDEDSSLLDRLYEQVTGEARRATDSDYWEIAAEADTLVTYAVASRSPAGIADPLKEASEQYTRAFSLRSTTRQRGSVLDHLEDLTCLAGDSATRYRQMFDQLAAFETVPGVGVEPTHRRSDRGV